MKSIPLILTVCAYAVLTAALPRRAAAQEAAAAIVEEIHGTAYWRRDANAKQERLDRKKHRARPLYPGQQVWCARGCVLRLRLGREPFIVPRGVWFTISQRDLSPSDPFRVMLNTVTNVTGVSRGNPLQIFSPPHHGVALPKPFVVRWVPTPQGCKFSLSITSVGSQIVWRQNGVDGSAGSLVSRKAERELQDFRARSGQDSLDLHIYDSCGEESHVTFSLLTVEKERALRRDIAYWAREGRSLTAHLGRASVYDLYAMYWHVAKEYEAALRLAPGSHQLLLRTISANRQIGNFTRAAELKKRLEAGAGLP